MIGFPYLTIAGAVLLFLVVVSTWYSPDFHETLKYGIPWLIILTISYFIWKKVNVKQPLKEFKAKESTTFTK